MPPDSPKNPPTRRSRSIDQPPIVRHDTTALSNRFRVVSTTEPGGSERHLITVPRRRGAWNRWEGSDRVKTILARAAAEGRRFHGEVRVESGPPGHRIRQDLLIGRKGGYDPARALSAIDNEGGLVWDWLTTQLGFDRIPEETGPWTVVGITLTTW